MSDSHVPVMLQEVLSIFRETNRPVGDIFDGTFGRGGHSRALLEAFSNARLWAFDQDADAISFAKTQFADLAKQGRAHFFHANFGDFLKVAEREAERGFPQKFDLMLLDLGVSSPQLDEAHRGFSFYADGPLDMRMDQQQSLTAADVVNELSEQDLAKVFLELGEVNRPYRVVRAIVHDRKTQPFLSTSQLAGLIERVDGWHKKGMHPATRYFMALRLYVNQELKVIEEVIPALIDHLNDGGRLAIITFHSLEDRIVKNAFKSQLSVGRLVNKKVLRPGDQELKNNPRSRSAKLRAFEKGPHHESTAV